jgi:hypothetical protein
MKKAIKINVETKSLEYITLGDDYKEIYGAIGNGCDTFCVPISFDNQDSMFADDESLLREHDIKGGFIMDDWHSPIVGNAIILGTDDDGNSVDCLTNIEDIKNQITFIDEKICKMWREKVLGTPKTFINL